MKLFNSYSKKKEEFIPINKNKVKIYVCGQTTYDYCHLGHARKQVVFDMIRRWFIASGFEVTYVENITDIEDKIIERAAENKEDINDLTTRFINYMHADFDKLGVLRPDYAPKATDYIPQMLQIIENLMEKGYAYQADNGDVYYSVRKFADYGKLSGKNLNDLRIGERVAIDKNKKDAMDFVLWKSAKENEPYWESSLGRGRPGWHIECSAMAEAILGKTFDIHGGGQDLQFPHHENEIAQSEGHNNCKFANYWLHNGFLNINDEKMSKSLGNFLTLREVLNKYDAEVIRFFMLKTHYRSPLNFNYELLDDVKNNVTRMYNSIKNFGVSLSNINGQDKFTQKFKAAMDDDFNTPLAISVLYELITEINTHKNKEDVEIFLSLANSIGLFTKSTSEFLQSSDILDNDKIEELIYLRNEAEKNKNFNLADEIRNNLLKQGIILEDNPKGTSWRTS